MTNALNRFIFLLITLLIFACNKKVQPSAEHVKRLKMIQSLNYDLALNHKGDFGIFAEDFRKTYYRDQFFRDKNNRAYYLVNVKKQNILDSLNQKFICSFLDKFGFQPVSKIGVFGQEAIFLTLIHADLGIQERYYRKAIEARKRILISPNLYTAFIDRFLMQKNCFQLYGTQMINYKGKFIPYPLKLNGLNQRRKEAGLVEGFEDVIYSSFEYKFIPEEYLKILPALIKEFRVQDCGLADIN